MIPHPAVALAQAVLAFHVGIILFNLFGMIAIPVGAWRGWGFVRVFWWRAVHVGILVVVAVQALVGRACILTLWQGALLGPAAERMPLIMRWVNRLVFWPLPVWMFAVAYVAVLLYMLALLRLVPPRWPTLAGRSGVR